MAKAEIKQDYKSLLEIREDEVYNEPIKEGEARKKSKYVFIKHNATEGYADPNKSGEYGKDLFPNFMFDLALVALDRSGKNFYVTGLNEKDYKEAYEKEFLNESIKILVDAFGTEVTDPFAERFWSDPSRRLVLDRDETILDLDNPDHLLIYWNIKGGGYPTICPTVEDLSKTNARFYLEEPHINYNNDAESIEKLKDKAIRILSEIDESGHSRRIMFILHKNLITAQEGTTEATPKSVLYKALRKYINGEYNESQKKRAPKTFLDTYELYKTNEKKAEVIAIVKDAIWYAILTTDKDHYFKNSETGYSFKTTDQNKVVDELCKVSNQEELISIMHQVQIKWNKY